jgi:hypothetical protein
LLGNYSFNPPDLDEVLLLDLVRQLDGLVDQICLLGSDRGTVVKNIFFFTLGFG